MEKKELRKIIEELDIKRQVVEMKGDTPDYDTDNRYYYLSEDDILVLLDKAREEGREEEFTEEELLEIIRWYVYTPVVGEQTADITDSTKIKIQKKLSKLSNK